MLIDGLDVTITRKPIKNLYLRVGPPSGNIRVSAPMTVSERTIARFVHSRRAWILTQQARMAAAAERRGDAGSQWTIERLQAAKSRIEAQLPTLVDHWEPIVGRRPTHITLRLMTSRWGSCTPATGRIRLNLQLAELPPRFLEYVLVHEMTHLLASGHGIEFQRRMSVSFPNWRVLRRELNQRFIG